MQFSRFKFAGRNPHLPGEIGRSCRNAEEPRHRFEFGRRLPGAPHRPAVDVEPDAPAPQIPSPAQTPIPPLPRASGSAPDALPETAAGAFPSASHEVSDERSEERRAAGEGPGGTSGAGAGDELTPEFASIASMLAEAFGQPLSVSVESAATTSDEDAAEELAMDGDAAEMGFTDEPVDDEDDE